MELPDRDEYRDSDTFNLEPENELIARPVLNAFGKHERITMRKWAWELYDWLRDVEKMDVDDWSQTCDRARARQPFGIEFEGWLGMENIRRYVNGLPRPPSFTEPPAGEGTLY
jgi:hypothetical protein